MAKFKIPEVYIEETPLLLPIINTQSSAVFIGYTEKHENEKGETLKNIPTKINTLRDFEKWFGKYQPEQNIEITDATTNSIKGCSVRFNGVPSLHNLYYSLQLFFDNGGNSCKIVSAGVFKSLGGALSVADLIAGLQHLENETGNHLIAVPESQNLDKTDFYYLQQRILEFCSSSRYFAILDLQKTSPSNYMTVISEYRRELQSVSLSFGAAFFPNLMSTVPYSVDESKVKIKKSGETFSLTSLKKSNLKLYNQYKSILKKFYVTLPPSSAITGAILRNDAERGIWSAPANISLSNVAKPEIEISTLNQDSLNVDSSGKTINCIRNFPGKGNLIWGSRTLAENGADWRYISVRRFASQVEIDILNVLKAFTFETNTANTWITVKAMTENYLISLWKMGALAGNKPDEAFFVKCGLFETMTAQDILDGNLMMQIGLAITKPAEFIVMSFSQQLLI